MSLEFPIWTWVFWETRFKLIVSSKLQIWTIFRLKSLFLIHGQEFWKKAGKLSYGCKINMFLFENYPIFLMFTWKHIYNSKYSNDSLLCVPYAFTFKNLISVITHMSLPLTLTAMDILKILDHELKTKT